VVRIFARPYQASKAGEAIEAFVHVFQKGLLILMYLSVALYLAPVLTILTAVIIGFLTYLLRNTIESAYTIGDRVAEANERIQRTVQAGTQGIREVKTLLGYDDTLIERFYDAMRQYIDSSSKVKRKEAFIGNAQNLAISLIVFALIYVSLALVNMSSGELGAFLFVIFKDGPMVSNVNKRYYQLEWMLPHLIRTEEFIDEPERSPEVERGDKQAPSGLSPIVFDDVSFSYDESDRVLSDISLGIEGGEFIALVGESGAGKSTIASLLARFYAPDAGEISAAGTPIKECDIKEWRSRIAYVRQNPFIFNTTLKQNLLIAKPDASSREIERVCEIAQVTEFLDDLPDGYENWGTTASVCRADSASAWRSPEPSWRTRTSFCSTRRRATSTRT